MGARDSIMRSAMGRRLMGMFDAIGIAGSGLTAERIRMDVTAENLANADTTKAANGQPYQRQNVVLAQVGASDFGGALTGAMSAAAARSQPPAACRSRASSPTRRPTSRCMTPATPKPTPRAT